MFINDNTFDNTLINISPASWSVNHKATSPFDTRVAEWDVTLDFNESSGKIDQVVFGQSGTTYDPRTMNYNTHYYWKIVSWDNHGASTAGPIWDFTTEPQPE